MKMKKKPYLLLELLIAFTLIAACAIPLVRSPLAAVRSELRTLEKNELERLSEVTFAHIKAELYQNAFAWDEIDHAKLPKEPLRKDQIAGFTRSIYIWTPYQKKSDNQEEHRIINVKIEFAKRGKRHAYHFQALATRLSINSEKKG